MKYCLRFSGHYNQILEGDNISGGYGNDMLITENTWDDKFLSGGEGYDTFRLNSSSYNTNTTITDFNVSEDKIDLSPFNNYYDAVKDFSQLQINQNGDDTVISSSNETIILKNIDVNSINGNHFIGITDTSHSIEDQVITGYGTLQGGYGNDFIISAESTSNYNTLTGGEGSDIFKIGALYSTTKDTITDFNIDEDKIDFSLLNFYSNHQDVTNFSQLIITQDEDDTVIVGGNATIILENVDGTTIDETNFISLDKDSEKVYNDITFLGSSTDTLLGEGNDTYIFNQGDGKDSIIDYQGNDTIVFGEGITKDDIVFLQDDTSSSSEYNINIQYGENDEIKLFSAGYDSYKIEQIELASGEILNQWDIDNIIHTMSSYAVEMDVEIGSYNDIKNNEVLMNIVTSSWSA